MSDLTRRTFLTAAAATGVAAATTRPAVAATVGRVKLTRQERRVVIIGSGFGGGVTALRFAQAGVPVTVLERGRRWTVPHPGANTFPSVTNPDKRVFWMANEGYRRISANVPYLPSVITTLTPYVGLLELIAGTSMDMVIGVGWGGGSLVYTGMTMQPDKDVFNATLPEQLDWDRMDRIHYPRVRARIKPELCPDDVIASPTYAAARIFAKNCRAAGYDVTKVPLPVPWDDARRELRGELKPSWTNGACISGDNNGGKHSLDNNYLKDAEATGNVEALTQHNVTDVEQAKDGRWIVHVDRIAEDGTVLERKEITTKALVMAAGTMNTTKLLMRAQHRNLIPDLPDALGQGWGTNGDRLYVWSDFKDDPGSPQGGPLVYHSKEWKNPELANTMIQAAIPAITGRFSIRSTMMVGFGVSKDRGHFGYDPKTGGVNVVWPQGGDAKLHARVHDRANAIAGPGSTLIDVGLIANVTGHPLGGANMGTVCDLEGRVKGHRGLYVLDGALLPGTTAACNPSMTIAAVAERATDDILATDKGAVF